MSIETETHLLTFQNWTYRLRPPQDRSAPVLLLLHGWTGDENSMWVFASDLPPTYWILAPRAPYPALGKGYSWREPRSVSFGLPSVEQLRPVAQSLLQFLHDWGGSEGVDVSKLNLMGFSQGAALSYTLAMLYPRRIDKLAGLSGFIPAGWDAFLFGAPFTGRKFYVAHGTQDELVSIERGREVVTILHQAGAQVTFCEADTGHKVSAGCFSGLGEYWKGG